MGHLSEDEPIRLDANEKNSKRLWYPAAIIPSQRMKTRGRYATTSGLPRGAIVHYTAGPDSAKGTINSGINNGYAYLCIQGNGDIYQAHPFNEWGYHAGKSSYLGLVGGVSDELVGIEINCAGKVEPFVDDDGETRFKSWWGKVYDRTQVRWVEKEANRAKGFYHKYTKEQEDALIGLLLWLKHNDPNTFSFNYVLGHDEVSPGRKIDPGGSLSMTMPQLRAKLNELYEKKVIALHQT